MGKRRVRGGRRRPLGESESDTLMPDAALVAGIGDVNTRKQAIIDEGIPYGGYWNVP